RGVRRGLLGPDQPAGLGRVRVGPTRHRQPALPARAAGTARRRGLPVDRPRGPALPRPRRRAGTRLRGRTLTGQRVGWAEGGVWAGGGVWTGGGLGRLP